MTIKRTCWLVKSEPESFSIHDLAKCPEQTTCWSGVRNYQARNLMGTMKEGDSVLFYHSSAHPPAVAGTAVVAREAYPDHTALDPKDHHYDPKATSEKPIWEMVDLRLVQIFPEPVPLAELRGVKELARMELLRRGSRLSVQPVRPHEFDVIVRLAKSRAKAAKQGQLASEDGAVKAAAKRKKKVVR
jgi:predicted RNA-binding protein with PUA-like domain